MESTQAVRAFCCEEHSLWHGVGSLEGGESDDNVSIVARVKPNEGAESELFVFTVLLWNEPDHHGRINAPWFNEKFEMCSFVVGLASGVGVDRWVMEDIMTAVMQNEGVVFYMQRTPCIFLGGGEMMNVWS
jgi:hypothetical protein